MNARVSEDRSTFRQTCTVIVDIDASPQQVWSMLTNAADMPRWNSAVTSIEGRIALGEKLAIRVPISDRTFKVKVTEMNAPSRMVWADGFAPMFRGVRTYQLDARDGGTRFSMSETLSGAMLPMIRKSLPEFGPSFQTYAEDLKAEAERTRTTATS